MQEIPFFDFASFTEDLTLDGERYRFQFHYNSRGDFWAMSISSAGGELLVSGIKMVGSYELIRQYRYAAIPPGALSVIDTAHPNARIGRQAFNMDAAPIYANEAELAAI